MSTVAEEYERRLWKELDQLRAETVPEGASGEDAARALMLALIGHDPEIADLFQRVRRLARTERGYLRERMQEDNPVADLERQLRGAASLRVAGAPPKESSTASVSKREWGWMLPLLLAALVVSLLVGLWLGDRILSMQSSNPARPRRELPNASDVWKPAPAPAFHPRVRHGS